jgi:hypothetical protein
MKSARKVMPSRKPARRLPPLNLTARIERLEKAVLFKTPAVPAPGARFINLGADGKPIDGDHVAVLQRATGLIWTAEPIFSGKEFTHEEALKACASLNLLGKKDWRAPTIQELLSIIDYERCDPAVDPAHFKGPYGWTWSSTIAKAPSGCAWFVGLYDGDSDRYTQSLPIHALAVRSGQQLGLLE